MAIPRMEDDLSIIGKLGDTPGTDNGLTTQQLKDKFDEGVKLLQKFINETLIPEMNATIDVEALLAKVLDSTLTDETKAANAKTTGEKISEVKGIAEAALPKSGGTMTGGINMNNQQLTGIPTPVSSANAVNKGYVDTKTVPITLPVDGWSGESAPYTQTVTVGGLTDANICHGHPVFSGELDEDLAMMEACSCVSYAKRNGAEVTFYCLTDKPETDITMEAEVGV